MQTLCGRSRERTESIDHLHAELLDLPPRDDAHLGQLEQVGQGSADRFRKRRFRRGQGVVQIEGDELRNLRHAVTVGDAT